jgi:hypothetical protein
VTGDTTDQYLGAQVLLPQSGTMLTVKVVGRKREKDGSLTGLANANPILDTRTYNVQFPDGNEAEHSANVIAESMWAQCDLDSNQHLLLIIDSKKDGHAVKTADKYIYFKGRKHVKKTTKGWSFYGRTG